jgi:hypothetical protein
MNMLEKLAEETRANNPKLTTAQVFSKVHEASEGLRLYREDRNALRGTAAASSSQNGVWLLSAVRGDPVIDPVILTSAGKSDEEGIDFNRLAVRARIDTVRRRIDLDQDDFSRIDKRPAYNIGVAVTGSLEMKRLWPVFAAADVRSWVDDHVSGGVVERVVTAGNAPLMMFKHNGPPLPSDGFSVDIETSATTLRPLATLPAIRDANLTVHVTGRTALINVGRGTVEVAPGRKLNIASGVFEVPDTHLKPAPARVHFHIDGTMPAAAALLATDALRENVGITLDPALSRGTIAAQVTVGLALGRDLPKDAATYSVTADLTNFSADKMLLGQRIEATTLCIDATSGSYQISGLAMIDGVPTKVDLRGKLPAIRHN